MLTELQAELDQLPADQLTYLMTAQGKAFTAAGFGNYYREMAARPACHRGSTRTA